MAIQRFNAVCILGTFEAFSEVAPEEPFDAVRSNGRHSYHTEFGQEFDENSPIYMQELANHYSSSMSEEDEEE